MSSVDIQTPAGKAAGKAELPAEIFDVQVNIPLMHQVVVAQLAAARQGTHDTKTRAFQTLTAAMYPRMQRQLATLTKQLKAKESEIARLTGASPRTSAGSPLPVTSASEPRPTSFAEALFGKKPEEM